MPTSLSIVFMGSDAWSVPSLDAIVTSEHRVGLVVSAAPKPSGRGHAVRSTDVAIRARELGADVVETDDVGGERAAIAALAPDVIVVVAFGQLLVPEVLSVARHGGINLHFSLLPRLRGASPVQGALLGGEAETGVTVMRMVERLDAGPILLQRATAIGPGDDAGSLGARLARIGAELLVEALDGLAAGTVRERPQDEANATWTRILRSADRSIDWSASAHDIVGRCRAFAPEPGAATSFRGQPLKVTRAEVAAPVASGHEPHHVGAVTASDRDGIVVACGEGSVRVLEVVPAGRSRMAAADFARGARLVPGERLGDAARG